MSYISIYLILFVQLWNDGMTSFHFMGMKNVVQIFLYRKLFASFAQHVIKWEVLSIINIGIFLKFNLFLRC